MFIHLSQKLTHTARPIELLVDEPVAKVDISAIKGVAKVDNGVAKVNNVAAKVDKKVAKVDAGKDTYNNLQGNLEELETIPATPESVHTILSDITMVMASPLRGSPLERSITSASASAN